MDFSRSIEAYSNKPAIVEFNGTKYAYVHNLQGDIVAILDSNGNAVVQYKYDAWGHPISKTGIMAGTLGTVQPFRYRGYVYDEETRLYYLRSRYYHPILSLFVNPDMLVQSALEPLGTNMTCYCENNPVVRKDSEGTFGLLAAIVTAGAVIGGLLGGLSAAASGGDAVDVLVGVVEGAINGAAGSYFGLTCGTAFASFVTAGAVSMSFDLVMQAGTQFIKTGRIDIEEIDVDKAIRTGVWTGIGAIIKPLGSGPNNMPINGGLCNCIVLGRSICYHYLHRYYYFKLFGYE